LLADHITVCFLLILFTNFHCVSHISQAASGGEDAFFANSDDSGVFAIADGVSGYAIF